MPIAVGDFIILDAVRKSDGFAIAVSDEAIAEAVADMARDDGLLLCPEGAATYAAFRTALNDGMIDRSDRCVLFNCATGLKYPLPAAGTTLDQANIDYSTF